MQEEHDRDLNNYEEHDLPDNDDDDDDIMQQSMELDRFEKKLSQQKRQNQFKVETGATSKQQQSKQQAKKKNSSSDGSDSELEDIPSSQAKPTKSKVTGSTAGTAMSKKESDMLYEELVGKAKEMRENNGVSKPPKKPSQPNQFEIVQQQYAQARSKDRRQDEILEEVLKANNDGFKEKKLKELLQRNRNLTMQYDKEKAMRIKLESQLNQMIKDHEEFIQYQHNRHGAAGGTTGASTKDSDTLSVRSLQSNITAKSPMKTKTKENSEEQEDWKDKFNKTDKKLQEFRVQNNHLKNELNKALRIITKEVGENISVDKILLEENGWKGRAQQIEKLKQKVKELQMKMGNMSYTSMNSEMSGAGSVQSQQHGPRGSSVGGLAAQSASERRKEQEEIKAGMEKLRMENELITSKLKAVNARKLILEKEQKDMRSELDSHKKLLLDKSNNDDRYIAALKAEVEKLKNRQPEVINKVVYQRVEAPPTTNKSKDDDSVATKLRQDIQYLKSEVESKERMIAELISEKIKADKGGKTIALATTNGGGNNNGNDELNSKVARLEEMVRTLKKEREEFFESKVADKESAAIIKDLSLQNAKLRSKIDDLMSKK